MKNNPSKPNFRDISCDSRDTVKTTQKKTYFSTKAVKTMAQQPIKPPARVWDKIQAILDEQDNRRNDGENIIASSFGITKSDFGRKKVF